MSVGIVFFDDGLKNLYRNDIDLFRPVLCSNFPLQILYNRFKKCLGISGMVLLTPKTSNFAEVTEFANEKNIKIVTYDISKIIEKPQYLSQQHWQTETDDGCDTFVGEPLAIAARETGYDTLIVIPLKNLLAEPSGVMKSLELYKREKFDHCLAADRISGAGWWIFSSDLLLGLSKSNPEIAWHRGAFAWALLKPLYPFKSGVYHCPRVLISIRADLRLNSERAVYTYQNTVKDFELFSSYDFSYAEFINNSGWEKYYTDFAPADIFIEPSSRCNASCEACPHKEMKRSQIDMSLEIFEKISSSFVKGDDCRWVFSGMGEPLLNANISEFVKTSSCFPSTFITSLQVSFPDDFPFNDLNQIRISVDSCSEPEFKTVREGCVWENIKKFLLKVRGIRQENKEYFPDVGVTMLRNGKTENRQQMFLSYYKKAVKPVMAEYYFAFPFDSKRSEVSWFQIIGESEYNGARKKTSTVNFEPVRRRICKNAVLGLWILSNGDVTVCPWDLEGKMTIGNVLNNSLKEIWQSEKAKNFRKSHICGNLSEPCNNCHDWYHYL